MGGSPGDVSEDPVTEEKRKKLIVQIFRHFTYVTPHSPTLSSLYLRHSSFSKPSVASPMSQFILQPIFRFSNVTSSSLNSPGEPPMGDCCICSDYQNLITSFNMISLVFLLKVDDVERYSSPTSHLILQPFRRFTYVTAHSPSLLLLHLRHSSFSNPSFASPTSQALHLIHLASRPWEIVAFVVITSI